MANLSAGSRTAAVLLAMASTLPAATPASAEPQRQRCTAGVARNGPMETTVYYGNSAGSADSGCDHILAIWGKYEHGSWGEFTFWGPNGHIDTTKRELWPRGSSAGYGYGLPLPRRVGGQLWCAAFRNDGRIFGQACVTS